MVVRIQTTLAERQQAHRPGFVPDDVDFRTGIFHPRQHDGSAPTPGDLPNRQGVHVVRRGRLVRLHDIAPESEKAYFDPDDVIEVPARSARLDGRHADDSMVPGLVGFITAADRHAENKKAAAEDKRKARAGKRIATAERRTEREAELHPMDRAIAQNRRRRFREIIEEQNADVSDLRRNGFAFEGGYMADRYYPAFTEYFGADVQRTDLHPMLKYFWSTIPAQARVGADKTFVEKCYSKQLAGNFPYIEGDPTHCRWIFKEIDGAVFVDAEHCYAALRQIFEVDKAFAAEGIDMMPNLVMGHTREDGTFEGGHLIWMFAPGSSVWTDLPGKGVDRDGQKITWGDERCRQQPVEALNRTRDSLCQLLLPIGGDPGQTNHRKPKSPVSPFMTVLITNQSNLFELADFPKIRNYPITTNKAAMFRDAEVYRAKTEGVSETLSMHRWSTCKAIASAVTKHARMSCEASFLLAQAESIRTKKPAALAAWVAQQMYERIKATDLEPGHGLDRVIKKQSEFAARLYMRAKIKRRRKAPVRGRDRNYVVDNVPAVDVTLPISERKAAEKAAKEFVQKARRKEAGRRSGALNASRTLWAFKENVSTWFDGGGADDLVKFLKEGLWAVSANTAKKYWEAVSAEFSPARQNGAKRYIASPVSGQVVTRSTVHAVVRCIDPAPSNAPGMLRQFESDDPPLIHPESGPSTACRSAPPWLPHAGSTVNVVPAFA